MIDRRALLLAAGLAPLTALAASAGDDGLYQDVFDPQSSFVRVLAPGLTFAAIDGGRIDGFEAGLSSYVNVMPGPIDIVLADTSTVLEAAPSTHYTIVFDDRGEPVTLVDTLELSPAKADVTLLNMTSKDDVELFVPAADAVAIDAVGADTGKSVALRAPLTLDFVLRTGDETLSSVAAVDLQRQSGVTIVLSESETGFDAVAVPNVYRK